MESTGLNQKAADKLYDLSELKKMTCNDSQFLATMAKLFVDTVPGSLSAMQTASENADWKTVGATAHKLKATIDTMRILPLTEIIRQAEKDGKQQSNTDELPGKVQYIISILQQCSEALKTEFSL